MDPAAAVTEIRRTDPHAPQFHFISPSRHAECFDPNGAIYWKGRYHLFYIFQDPAYCSGPEFWQRGHCWGHASSADLVDWTHHPTALAPEPGDPEAAIYSGCAFLNKEGVPTIVYHGYGAGTCIATAEDDSLLRWRKSPHNPVIPEPRAAGDAGWNIYNVFDPHVWLEDGIYHAVLGGKVKPEDKFDTGYRFRSSDLVRWEYVGPLYAPKPEWTTERDDCACPKYFSLGQKQMLLCISHALGTRYYLGREENGRFLPDEHHLMNWPGGCCFAPETVLDGKGRRIMWAWAVDQRDNWWEKGEIGVLTMPRFFRLDDEGALRVAPIEEWQALRDNHRQLTDIALPAREALMLESVFGDCLELRLEASYRTTGSLTVYVRCAADGSEATAICFDFAAGELSIDASRSSDAVDGFRPYPMDFWSGVPLENIAIQRAPFSPPEGENWVLRIFLDRTILEVFANDHLCMTQRIYPHAESTGILLESGGDACQVKSLDAWDLRRFD